jgi:hypothetical protein
MSAVTAASPEGAPAPNAPDPEDDAAKFVRDVKLCANRSGSPILRDLIDQCEEQKLFGKFVESDREANRLQSRHRHAVHWAVWPSAAALILGIFQLGFHKTRGESWTENLWLLIGEAAIILLSAAAVVVGKWKEWHGRWLLERYRAERLRLLIFDLAVDARLWKREEPQDGDWRHWIFPKITEIERITENSLPNEAVQERPPTIPAPSDCEGVSAAAIEPLIGFYSRAWLDSQIEYFTRKINEEDDRFWDRSGIAFTAFAISAAVVLIHVAFATSGNRTASFVCLILAACIPAAAAVWKTFRSALELSRNASRAGARLAALNNASTLLHDEDPDQRPKPEDEVWFKFETMAVCQSLLANEQREWLRLMRDAEWFQ